MVKDGKSCHFCVCTLIGFAVLLLLGGSSLDAKETKKLKPEELVSLHLKSLGGEAARKTCLADGTGVLTVIRGGGGTLRGPVKLLADGRKFRMSILFNRSDYPAEEVSFDGNEVDVSQLSPGRRSPLGEFLYQYDEIVAEGLFGGVLSTGWSLLEVAERKPKLKYEGIKKIDDVEYHTLRYRPKKRSDVDIRLYFDLETLQHILTIYKVRFEPFAGRSMDERALQAVVRYDVRESFGEFKEVGGLTLPARWTVDYTREVGMNIDMLRWTMDYEKIESDVEVNPSFFRLH